MQQGYKSSLLIKKQKSKPLSHICVFFLKRVSLLLTVSPFHASDTEQPSQMDIVCCMFELMDI